MSFELYRKEEPSFRSVTLNLQEDELSVHTQDMGKVTEAVWGDSDYEFWTSIDRGNWGELLVALIREFLADEPRATDRLREICVEHDVPYEWSSWA